MENHKVLVVDDRKDERDLLSRILQRYIPGVQVLQAGSAESCYETIRLRSPSCIILDVQLGAESGLHVLETIKKDEANADLPILIVSGVFLDVNTRIKALRDGAVAFFCKPYEPEELAAQIQVVLEEGSRVSTLMERAAQLERDIQNMDSEKEFFLNSVPELFIFFDQKRTVEKANRAALEALGKTESELIGQPCYALWGHSSGFCSDCPVEQVWHTGKPAETIQSSENGQTYRLRALPMKHGPNNFGGILVIGTDVTDAVEARREIEEREKKFRTLFESSKDAIMIETPDGDILEANQAAGQLFGYGEELIGMNARDLVASDAFQAVEDLAEHPRESVKIPMLEARGKNGDPLWVEVVTWRSRIEGEQVIFVHARDVSLEKEVREQLALSEHIVKSADDMVVAVDREGLCLAANPALLSFAQLKKEQVLGQHISRIFGRELYQQDVAYCIEKALYDEHVQTTIQWPVGGEDAPRYLQFRCEPLKDEQDAIIGALTVLSDITQLKTAERALRESEQKFRHIFEAAADGIFIMRGEQILDCNQRAVDLFGREREELIQMTPYELSPLKQPDRRMSKTAALQAIQAAETGEVQTFDWVHQRKNGELFYAEISLSLVEFSGEFYIQAFIRDITERMSAQKSLSHRYELEHLVTRVATHLVTLESEEVVQGLEYALDVLGRFFTCKQVALFSTKRNNRPHVSLVAEWHGRHVTPQPHPAQYNLDQLPEWMEPLCEFGVARNSGHEQAGVFAVPMIWMGELNGFLLFYLDEKAGEWPTEDLPFLFMTAELLMNRIKTMQAEDFIRASEEHYRLLVENQSDLIVKLDPGGRILFANRPFMDLIGKSWNELDGASCFPVANSSFSSTGVDAVLSAIHPPYRNLIELLMETKEGKRWIAWQNQAIVYDGQVEAVICVGRDVTERREAEDKLEESRQQLRDLASHLESVREEERKMMAREIHDQLGQDLSGLKMDLSWISSRIGALAPGEKRDQIIDRVADMDHLFDETIQAVRRISAELRPGILDDLGLGPAVEAYAREFERRSGIVCQVDSFLDDLHLPDVLATPFYRVSQELLTNVLRHAKASKIQITIEQRSTSIVMLVEDDGCGIRQEELQDPKSLGILGMKERMAAIGGYIEFRGETGKGTCVTVRAPFASQDEDEYEYFDS